MVKWYHIPMAIGRAWIQDIDMEKGFVYILKSLKNGSYYIGSTLDVHRRLEEHQRGKTASLKYLLPLELVFYQEYPSIREAQKVEKTLKKHKNKSIIDRIVKEKVIKLQVK